MSAPDSDRFPSDEEVHLIEQSIVRPLAAAIIDEFVKNPTVRQLLNQIGEALDCHLNRQRSLPPDL